MVYFAWGPHLFYGQAVFKYTCIYMVYSCIKFTDPSDTDLRHVLPNMIAVVFALPSRSNHIWYHMFCPGDLEDSYITGFMVMLYIEY